MKIDDWFYWRIAQPRHSHFIEVDGAQIHYQTWNQTDDKPVLLFVHGHAAHSHWWDFIAPAFTDDYCVAAMDMSGAGDSDHRPAYYATGFANEIRAVASKLGGAATVVGHSFGGSMTRIAGWQDHQQHDISQIVILDSAISRERVMRAPLTSPAERIRYYPSLEQGMRRFRLRPPQPCANKHLLAYIASHSLRRDKNGYVFKLDQHVFAKMPEEPGEPLPDSATMIEQTRCPVGFIYGAESRFFPAEKIALLETLIAPDRLVRINQAWHHLFLDQPGAFTEELKKLLSRMSR
ncbi:MAG: alpha/beta hydrolase [Pseudomonadales bacterium]|nr:alpha/beta hydrolase [Pseudomonadales bacterium]